VGCRQQTPTGGEGACQKGEGGGWARGGHMGGEEEKTKKSKTKREGKRSLPVREAATVAGGSGATAAGRGNGVGLEK